ncbi:hypothetical protein PI124_g2798 [Phytophthora idaei]|nr:hypothetical protein PI124_g2798 [Phytophthora idaei]
MRSFESNIQDLYREWHRDHEFSKKANERRLLLSHIIDIETDSTSAQEYAGLYKAKFQTRQKARRSKDSSVEVPTRKDIRQRLREMKQMEPHELIVALGLVIARMMCPH